MLLYSKPSNGSVSLRQKPASQQGPLRPYLLCSPLSLCPYRLSLSPAPFLLPPHWPPALPRLLPPQGFCAAQPVTCPAPFRPLFRCHLLSKAFLAIICEFYQHPSISPPRFTFSSVTCIIITNAIFRIHYLFFSPPLPCKFLEGKDFHLPYYRAGFVHCRIPSYLQQLPLCLPVFPSFSFSLPTTASCLCEDLCNTLTTVTIANLKCCRKNKN